MSLRLGTALNITATMAPIAKAATVDEITCTQRASLKPKNSVAINRHPISGHEYPGQPVIAASTKRKLIKTAAIIIPSLIIYFSFIVLCKPTDETQQRPELLIYRRLL